MKRIVICADGTWNSPEAEHGSHVIRLARGIAPVPDAAGSPGVPSNSDCKMSRTVSLDTPSHHAVIGCL